MNFGVNLVFYIPNSSVAGSRWLVKSDKSGGMTIEIGKKVSLFVDREKVLTLRAMVVIALESTLGHSTIVEEDTFSDFTLANVFNLRRKMSDKDFSASDVSFLSLNRGSNL